MAATQLPLVDLIERSSGPKSQGFKTSVVSYSSKVSQKAFDGPSQDASREEVWTVKWKLLERLTPEEVVSLGKDSTYDLISKFYEDNYMGQVKWQPFEHDEEWVWEIQPNSIKKTNSAGCIFNIQFDLKFLYKLT